MLGRCDRVVVGKDQTTIVADSENQEALLKRIQQIRAEIDATDNKFDKEKMTERIAALGGGIARIKVGAATETELKDKKLRYEDALNSVKSALEMGVVPGGGACMLYMSCDVELKNKILASVGANEDERLGVEIMFRSLPAPMKQIAKNAGLEGKMNESHGLHLNGYDTSLGEVVAEKCKNKPFGYGYNAATDEYEDLLQSGVLDPAKVTINALENAASIAALVLTTEVLITEIPKRETPQAPDPK